MNTDFRGRRIGEDISGPCENEWCSAIVTLTPENCCGGIEGAEGVAGCGGYFCDQHMLYNRLWQYGRCERCEKEELA